VAVCLLPGTELAFEEDVECEVVFGFLRRPTIGHRLARFRKVREDQPTAHHDALEFPDGRIVLLTQLREGQRATVLQLPATPHVNDSAQLKANADVRESRPEEMQEPLSSL